MIGRIVARGMHRIYLSGISLYFDKHDLWIGAYWRHDEPIYFGPAVVRVYVCLLPAIVLRFRFEGDSRL